MDADFYKVLKVEWAKDEKKADWLFFTVDSLLGRNYYAISPFYDRFQFPFVSNGAETGAGYDMNVYAASHSRYGDKSPEAPIVDKNGVKWYWVKYDGTFTNDFWAGTDGYGGQLVKVVTTSEVHVELVDAIDVFAKAHKPGGGGGGSPPKPPPKSPPLEGVEPLPATRDDVIKKGWGIALARNTDKPSLALAHVSQGWMESYLGTSGQFLLAGNVPSWNWGAVIAREGQDFFQGTMKFARFKTMEAGYLNYLAIPSLALAAPYYATGDVLGAVSVLYDHHYFVVDGDDRSASSREYYIKQYANAVMGAAGLVAGIVGQPQSLHLNGKILPPPPGTPEEGGGGGLVLAGAAAVAIAMYLRK